MSYYDPEKKRAMESSLKAMEIKEEVEKGELPKNEEIKHFLKEGEEVLEEAKEEIGDLQSRKVVEKTQDVLDSIKDFLDARNQDEILQRIGKRANQLLQEAKDKTLSKQDRRNAKRLIEETRIILRNLIVSGNLRRTILSMLALLTDLGINIQTTYEETKEEEFEEKEPSEKVITGIEKAEESVDRTKETSQQKIRNFEDRLVDLMQEIRSNQSLKDFRNHSLFIFDYVQRHFRAFDEGILQKSSLEIHLIEMLRDVREFLQQFTPKENLKTIESSIRELFRLADEDESMKKIGLEWRDIGDKSIEHPNYAVSEENKERVRKVVERVKEMLREEKLSRPFNNLIHSMQKMINDIQNDPVRVKMDQDLRNLFSEFMLDESGNVSLNQNSLQRLQTIIVPSIVKQLKYIAIPKIHSESGAQEFTMRDIFVSVPDIIPEKIHFDIRSTGTVDTKQMGLESSHSRLLIHFSDIEVHIPHAKVHFKRYAFPKMEDNLLVNTDVRGPNTHIILSIRFDTVNDRSGRQYLRFSPDEIQVKLDHLRIKVLEGKHDTLMNFFTTVLNPLVKSRVQRDVADGIRGTLERICEALTDASYNTLPTKLQQTIGNVTSEIKASAH